MALTGSLGTSDSQPENTVPGFGASSIAYKIFSGLYILTPGKTNDTLFLSINYPAFTTIDIGIPNPYVETGLIGGINSPADQ